jgi:putative sterol carrier protein
MPTASEISQMMVESFVPEKAEGVNSTIQFDLSGDGGGQFYIVIQDGTVATNEGTTDNPQMTLKASIEDYYAVATGSLNAVQAFMSGKIKVSGDMGLAMKMQQMFKTG